MNTFIGLYHTWFLIEILNWLKIIINLILAIYLMIKLARISILIKATCENFLILSLKDLELDDNTKTEIFFLEREI